VAACAAEIFAQPERLPEIKADLVHRRGGVEFVNPIPPDAVPDMPPS